MNNNISFDSLQPINYKKEATYLRQQLYTIVKPRLIEEFICSFFENYNGNDDIKKRLIFSMDDFMRPRDSNLFDYKTNSITLSSDEINLINSGLFSKNLKIIYDSINIKLITFHQEFVDKYSISIEKLYNDLLDFINDKDIYQKSHKFYGLVNKSQGKIKNLQSLELNLFQDEANYYNLRLNNQIKNKLLEILSLYNKVTVINTDPNKYFSEQLLTNLEKSKIPKTLFDFITNVNDKKKFVNDLKSNFKSEFGISFKILIELLKEEKIILQGDREFKKLYNAIKVNFNRDIGTYVSLNDYYKHSTDHKKSIKMILRL